MGINIPTTQRLYQPTLATANVESRTRGDVRNDPLRKARLSRGPVGLVGSDCQVTPGARSIAPHATDTIGQPSTLFLCNPSR